MILVSIEKAKGDPTLYFNTKQYFGHVNFKFAQDVLQKKAQEDEG